MKPLADEQLSLSFLSLSAAAVRAGCGAILLRFPQITFIFQLYKILPKPWAEIESFSEVMWQKNDSVFQSLLLFVFF